ncbi:MAG TPA: FAD/NAD(P)-binding oxidoreductase [Rhodocyclaceae bacterium]|jgi:NADPH-dependent 2,4-dienoyl-CoA reductase/sulfur reductase-like enzyme|nr:FAD/NAD(P)-binding oxidoreductase [Rhodocyclaceae bacterium]HMW78105.1 FAD/NAD(P)-binding oxidoreductase [Rhodocyclaceae bacterium]HNE42580.1 FAD/NAD(P)-binding oxidoreductase [Rhodocyclaceae bacterium]HNM21253.1 FAD/NAD(P)-binding oxidoreductase [Rhodocyclaceae bacterium]HNM80330.1 FAD/NAD(P)-binding oxidoreductase [Rhodocyclaceae bacterium]
MTIDRRKFTLGLGLSALAAPISRAFADGLPTSLLGANPIWIPASTNPVPVPTNLGISGRVVVIGGGMGGATAAKYLRLWGGSGVKVTLVERATTYTSNIMSNLVLNGSLAMSSLSFGYDRLRRNYGISVVTGEVTGIDPVGKQVMLKSGTRLPYDRLIVAPGIEFDVIPGLESAAAQTLVPHAWKAGPQTTALRDRIKTLRRGGVFVMSIPAAPYRCPPGPYERACLVADYLKRNNPGAKVIVLDANPKIVAEAVNFGNAFNLTYAGIVDYRPGVSILSIDAAAGTVNTSAGPVKGDVINAIPPQRAGGIIATAGLNNVGGRWAGVDVLSYESTAARAIHVIGDAAATTQPKAGHIANQEAKVCVDAILRGFKGLPPDAAPVTNSACFSPITATTASWLTAILAYDPATGTMKSVTGAVEAPGPNAENFNQMKQWFSNLMTESFA